MTRWYRLLDADELHDPEDPLGELELSVQWIHDPQFKDLPSKRLTLLEVVQRTLGEGYRNIPWAEIAHADSSLLVVRKAPSVHGGD